MTDDRDADLETRLRAHYETIDPGPAAPGWAERVERSLDRRARPGGRWRSVLPVGAAAVAVVAVGLIGLRLALMSSASAAPSLPTSTGTPSASVAPSSAAATVDRFGAFPGGVWAVRGPQFLVSTDGGASWSVGTTPSGSATSPDSWPWLPVVAMTDATHAWMVTAVPGSTGDGSAPGDVMHLRVSRTVDGGGTWASVDLPGNWPGTSVELAFPDPRRGFILVIHDRQSLAGGAVFTTGDGGQTWSMASGMASWAGPGLANSWLGSEFAASDAATLWAGANAEAGPVAHPVLAVSRDAGKTWQDVPLPGLAAAVGGTAYGGTQAWLPVPPMFTSPDDGWVTLATSDASGSSLALVYRTTDGGRSWRLVADQPGQSSGGIAVLSPTHWLLPVDNLPYSGLLETTDGGTTWAALPGAGSPTAPWVVSLDAAGASRLIAAAPAGNSYPARVTLLLSSDTGRTWSPATLPAP